MTTGLRPKAAFLSFLACFGLSLLVTTNQEASAQSAQISATLKATRLNGPAPLAVMFDATETRLPTPADPFREATYSFDFGDDRGLNWEHSGKPRNSQSGGPLAAHVYDLPGEYSVRLNVTTSDGQTASASLTITVEDPNATFPGEKTVCVSPSAKYAGCPAKALRETRLPVSYGGKRVLLNRGEAFGSISVNRNSDGIIIGSYGSGPKPVVEHIFVNAGRLNDNFTEDLTVMDLDVSDGFTLSGSGARYLIYRNDLTRPGGNNMIDIGGALAYLAEQNPRIPFYNPREIFIVDNVVRGQVNSAQRPLNNLAGMGSRFVIMGNDLSRSEQHTVRLFAVHKGFIAHNALRGMTHGDPPDGTGGSIRSALKIHSGGLLPYADDWSATMGRWATSQLIIADNQFGDPANNGYFTAGVAPQNRAPGTAEGIEDVLIERNRFIRGPYTNTEMENFGRRITTRDNSRLDGQPPNLSVGQPSPSLPPEWHGPFFRQ